MDEKNYTGAIPHNQDGGIINAKAATILGSPKDAKALFEIAKQRLLNVNAWHTLSGDVLAHFYLTEATGSDIDTNAAIGYFIKIDIPGPGTISGDGYDWVRIEALDDFCKGDIESVAMRVRPSANPMQGDKHIAHFYAVESTSTFTVTREYSTVTAAIYDRNTKTNSDAVNIQDKLRNTLTGTVGRLLLSKIQWKKLTAGLIA